MKIRTPVFLTTWTRSLENAPSEGKSTHALSPHGCSNQLHLPRAGHLAGHTRARCVLLGLPALVPTSQAERPPSVLQPLPVPPELPAREPQMQH